MRFVMGILCLIGEFSQPQHSKGENPMLLEPTLPSVYMRYVGTEKRAPVHSGESGNTVRIVLHNNTKGAISLCTESLYIGSKVSPLTLWSGKTVLALRDGTEAAACYTVEREVENRSGKKGSVAIDAASEYLVVPGAGGDVSSTSWVASGGSIMISVPKEDLGVHSRISVSFNYEWELDAKNEAHLVFFPGHELPQ